MTEELFMLGQSMRLSVVIPTYNEAPNIESLIARILVLPLDLVLIVVDDNSPDGTANLVRAEANRDDRVRLISRKAKLGLGTAYAAGIALGRELGADCIATMDADFSHEPEALPLLLAEMEKTGADLVVGSRYVIGGAIENWGLLRRLLSAGANHLTRLLVGIPLRDCTSGFRLYRREIFDKVDPASIQSHGYSYLEEMIAACWRAGAVIRECPIRFVDRRAGSSKISRTEIVKGAWTLLRLALGRFRS